MGNFNRSFNRDSRSGGGGFNRRGSGGDREMFKTTCSNCGRECEVPFKPNGSKPVFCSNCFEKNGGETRRSNDRDYSAPRRPNFQDRRPDFNQNQSYDRPQNFQRPQENASPAQNNDQFASLNAKLDKIITLLTPKPTYQEKKQSTEQSETSSKEAAPVVEKKKRSPKKAAPAPVAE